MNRSLGVFWKQNDEFLNDLASILRDKRVLEIFAGNGYLASILESRGIQIRPTSLFSGHDAHEYKMYTFVYDMDAVRAVQNYGDDRDILLLSWPTTTIEALRAIQAWGPDRDIVYIGEITDYSKHHLGGCATDEFFEHLKIRSVIETYDGNIIEKAVVARYGN